MTYKYYTILSPPTSASYSSASATMIDGFQSLINTYFSISTDYYVIQEEDIIGSGIFTDTEVRITGAISSLTGEKLSDDFKQILFKQIDHNSELGKKYYFSSNYWICSYSEGIKTLSANSLVRRCNNTLRWMDKDTGEVYSEECAIEYKISRPRDEIGTVNPALPAGYMDVYCQLNNKTKKIQGNQRFLFGDPSNRIAYKVFGDGVRSFINQQTTDDTSGQLLLLSMGGNYINEQTDDLINGIADRYLDYNAFTSASSVGSLDIISIPSTSQIFESASAVYTVNYYSGSIIHSGSFVFTVSGSNVPVANYTLSTLTPNSFSIINNERWLDDTLNVVCSGSSGSRVLNLELRGKW